MLSRRFGPIVRTARHKSHRLHLKPPSLVSSLHTLRLHATPLPPLPLATLCGCSPRSCDGPRPFSSSTETSSLYKSVSIKALLAPPSLLSSSSPSPSSTSSSLSSSNSAPSTHTDPVTVTGWVRTLRQQKRFSFVSVYDGTYAHDLQCVADNDAIPPSVSVGASVSLTGQLVVNGNPKATVPWELQVSSMAVLGDCPSTFPLQAKYHSTDFLRSIIHLRSRTATTASVFRVRSALQMAIHSFFHREGFTNVHTPVLTPVDCEGAGSLFQVYHQQEKSQQHSPPHSNTPDTEETHETMPGTTHDDASGFFGRPVYLGVSGQLYAEMLACSLSKVYTFAPTFRAELSNTTRHLAEFWMVEPEMAQATLEDVLDNCERLVQHAVGTVLTTCSVDLDVLAVRFQKGDRGQPEPSARGNQTKKKKNNGKRDKEQAISDDAPEEADLLEILRTIVQEPFARISYCDAVAVLAKEAHLPPVQWGDTLGSAHEKFLAEKHFGRPVFVTHYPAKVKPFYMRASEKQPDVGRTVACFDLLVPGVGELAGGSEREERLSDLRAQMVEHGLKEGDYSWYMDLRKFGTVRHGGFGLGFDRLVKLVTGIDNVRDTTPVPRVYGCASP